jgi:hypothetical protein
MNRLLIAALAAMLAGCASTASLRPTVKLTQTSVVDPVTGISRNVTSTRDSEAVPVDFQIEVTNPLEHPVTLTSVEMETVGQSGSYALRRVRHAFTEVIPGRGSKTLQLRAWVHPLQASDQDQVQTPAMIRGVAQFDSAGTTLKTAFVERLDQR